MKTDERENLRYIRKTYGGIIDAAALRFQVKPELLAAIMHKESEGGLSPLLDRPGPEGRGDKDKEGAYRAFGLMQVDRFHKQFCQSEDWKDPFKNIMKGASILADMRKLVKHIAAKRRFVIPEDQLEAAIIAAYNGGPSAVVTVLQKGLDVDTATTGGSYSTDVLHAANLYREVLREDEPSIT